VTNLIYSSRTSFSFVFLKSFFVPSACIRDPASNWDPFNIILIVTGRAGVEVVIGNCLPDVHKILPGFRNWEEKFSIMVDDASCFCLVIPKRMRLSDTVTDIWRLKGNGVITLTFWGHVTSSVTWPCDSQGRLPMGGDHASIWHRYGDMAVWSSSRKTPRNRGRSSVFGRSLILHCSHILLFATLGT